ncbi:carboxypeptidase regulatory-like domain-containing protein [candidate division TA06 bacterium]|nr:carboxypeptidase regulatory-like domain-containing protein [candidate division TA06 bacterium]
MRRISVRLFLTTAGLWLAAAGIVRAQTPVPGTIVGVIKDRESGAPMKGMITFPGLDLAALVSDSAGNYKVDLAPGEYKMHIYANGYRWIERKLTVTSGKTEQWDLTLKRKEAVITGTVQDSATAVPIKAHITNLGSIPIDLYSDAAGKFQLTVKPGAYQFSFAAQGYKSDVKNLSLKDKAQSQLDVKLARAGSSASGKWQAMLGGGVTKLMGGVLPEASYGYMMKLGAGYNLNEKFAFCFNGGYGSNKIKGILWDPNYQLYQTNYIDAEVDARYKFNFWEKITPYLMAGGGILYWENVYNGALYKDPATGVDQTAVSPIIAGGAGMEYQITPAIFLWAQGKGGMFLTGDKITTGYLIKDNLIAEGSLGAGYKF